jgi:hypothetical protein
MTTEVADEAEASFYKPPDEKVRPGDVVRLSPFFQALKDPLVHLGPNKIMKGGRQLGDLLGGPGEPVPAAVLNGKQTEFVVRGKLDFALLLTRGCDIDKGSQRQLAAIRPLTTVQGVEQQASIIEGKTMSLHYVPASERNGIALFPESFVDFRYIVTLDASSFDKLERVTALARTGLLDVYFGWMRHTIGQRIPATLDCKQCGAPIPVFAGVAEIANPPADY